MKDPIISLILLVYNTETTIRQCVDSVLSQTFTNFEAIMIDDGSTDTSGSICDEYAKKDSRVRVIHKSNGGISSVRNLGIDEAKGEWITFIDTDDIVKPSYLEYLMKLESKEFRLCGFEGDGFRQIQPELLDSKNNDFNTLIHHPIAYTTWCKLFSIKVIRENNLRFDSKMRLGEDTVFSWNYIACIDDFSVSNNKGYIYTGIWGGGPKYNLSLEELSYRTTQHFDALNNVCSKHNIKTELYLNHAIGVIGSYKGINDTDKAIRYMKTIPKSKWREHAIIGKKHQIILTLIYLHLYNPALFMLRFL